MVDRAENSMTTNIINNTAIAEATVVSNQASASMSKNTITYQGWSYTDSCSILGLTETSDKLNFIFYINLMNINKANPNNLVVNLGSAEFNV